MKTILMVEDNDTFFNAGYTAMPNYSVDRAIDLCQAMSKLRTQRYEGAIIDCFFPEETGTNKSEIGKSLVARLQESDPNEKRMREGMEQLKDILNFEDPQMRTLARYLIHINDNFENSVMRQALTMAKGSSVDVVTRAFKNTIELIYREDRAPKDYYGDLFRAIETSEANQPLGIVVAEKAAELHIPFVLTTSTYHHDSLTQPIQNFATEKGWKLIDCDPKNEDDKATRDYWIRVIDELGEKRGTLNGVRKN